MKALAVNQNFNFIENVSLSDIRREQCRRSLRRFAYKVKTDFMEGLPQKRLIQVLTDVYHGKLDRVIVSMPPRHGKSLMVSQIFPCWVLGNRPKTQIIQTGYSHDISLEQSRHARDLFVSEECREVFPHIYYTPQRASQNRIPVEKQAAHEWGTLQGGRYYSVGVGGGLTGRGADIGIIDDPVKNREEAESATVREKVWNWYCSTFYTRLSPTGAVILVMTRWHPDDLAGRLLKQMAEGEGEKWELVELQAEQGNGKEALWPERWPLNKLHQIKKAIGQREYTALYMQKPTLQGGNIFHIQGVTEIDIKDFPDTRYARMWDLASSEKQRTKGDPDFTVGALGTVIKRDDLDHLYIKDLQIMQKEKPARDAIIRKTAEQDGASVIIGVEANGGYKDAYVDIRHALAGKRIVMKVISSRDKVVRASPLEPLFEQGHIFVPRGAWWLPRFYQEFADFPSTAHDDVVDAVTTVYHYFLRNSVGAIDRESLRI